MFLARNGPELYVSSSTYFTWFSRLYSIHNRGAGGTGRRRPGKRAKTRYRHRQIRPISVPYDVPITVPSPNLRHRHPDKFTSSSIALSANGPFYTEVYRACVPLVNAQGLQEHVGINYRADSRNNSANLNGLGRMEGGSGATIGRGIRPFPRRPFAKFFETIRRAYRKWEIPGRWSGREAQRNRWSGVFTVPRPRCSTSKHRARAQRSSYVRRKTSLSAGEYAIKRISPRLGRKLTYRINLHNRVT